MPHNQAVSKMQILREAVDRLEREREADRADSGKNLIRVPVDPLFADPLRSMDPKVAFMDDRPGDPLEAYVECLKSLCETTGGKWVDDVPGKAAGCYFRTNVEAAGYAALAWTCLPGGFLRYVFG